MNLNASYFSLSPVLNSRYLLDRWLNPRSHRHTINLRGHPLAIEWTHRAHRVMQRRSSPLIVELQLYFSCVIKKRVLFHDRAELSLTRVSDYLAIGFRPVQAASCDLVEFARDYPVKREFDSSAAARMHPRALRIDYQNGRFEGEYEL